MRPIEVFIISSCESCNNDIICMEKQDKVSTRCK